MKAAALEIVKAARAHNKCVATACGPADYRFWIEQNIDLLFCANDIACLKKSASDFLNDARSILHA